MSFNPPAPSRTLPRAVLAAVRPRQWAKNVLVLPALVFSGHYTSAPEWGRTALAFLAFSLLSSTGYVYNDLRDVDSDRRHPKKRFRPLAAGEIGPRAAWALIAVLGMGAAGVSIALGRDFAVVAALYFATTLAYSGIFKHRC